MCFLRLERATIIPLRILPRTIVRVWPTSPTCAGNDHTSGLRLDARRLMPRCSPVHASTLAGLTHGASCRIVAGSVSFRSLQLARVRVMLASRVIPCLDVDKGRVVKGTNFLNLRDAGDPVELAERYDAEGADELVFLDITASHEARETIAELARRTADNVFIPFTIGGGIRSRADAQAVLDAGADKVSVNSAAVARPALVSELAETFGAQCVVLAIDGSRTLGKLAGELARRRPFSYEVFVNGGRI